MRGIVLSITVDQIQDRSNMRCTCEYVPQTYVRHMHTCTGLVAQVRADDTVVRRIGARR